MPIVPHRWLPRKIAALRTLSGWPEGCGLAGGAWERGRLRLTWLAASMTDTPTRICSSGLTAGMTAHLRAARFGSHVHPDWRLLAAAAALG
jgi:hypothetical protein